MHDWLIALILGIVEGITEFLPVSSTGHLLIAEKFLHSHQSDLFNVVIQCGAVIAVPPPAGTDHNSQILQVGLHPIAAWLRGGLPSLHE